MKKWIIIDSEKNVMPFEPYPDDRILNELIKENIKYATRHKTLKSMDNEVHRILKENDENGKKNN